MQATAPPHLLDATMFWNPSGGLHRYLCAKRDWLQSHTDWRHTVASPTPDAVSTLRLDSAPFPGSGGGWRLPWRRSRLASTLLDARPTLIEAEDAYRTAWAVLDAADKLSIAKVAFCHSNLAQLARLAGGSACGRMAECAARRYARHLYRHFDLVLAPSRAMTDHLLDWGIARAEHQPLGVDAETFHPRRRDKTLRDRLGVPGAARLLVFVGRFAPEKHLQTLADAVRRLGPRYWLIAQGAGPSAPSGERVIVLPVTRDPGAVATLLASCDAFVHAGRYETFGLAALEAMACGLPVVAPPAEGLAELVDDSVGGRVAGTTPADFADAIAGVFARDPVALGRAARRVAEEHDWRRVMPILHARYLRLMGG